MTRITLPLSLLFVVTILATGCVSAPIASPTPPPTTAALPANTAAINCRQLSTEIANAEAAKRAALEKEKSARKPIVPFVAAAHYIGSKSAAEKTDRQISTLRAEFSRQGCDRHGA